jgi:hypothetical protein
LRRQWTCWRRVSASNVARFADKWCSSLWGRAVQLPLLNEFVCLNDIGSATPTKLRFDGFACSLLEARTLNRKCASHAEQESAHGDVA